MRRKRCYLLVFLMATFLPRQRIELRALIPIEVIRVQTEQGNVMVWTDSGHTGTGETLQDAFYNVEDNAEGIIYWKSARYLIVNQQGLEVLDEVKPFVRSMIKVCWDTGDLSMETAAAYLTAHNMGVTLRQILTSKACIPSEF